MNCPKCNGVCEPWKWEDGAGHKGVECSSCGAQWHSDEVDEALYEVQRKAVAEWMTTAEFPKDAMPEEEWRANALGLADRFAALRSGGKR